LDFGAEARPDLVYPGIGTAILIERKRLDPLNRIRTLKMLAEEEVSIRCTHSQSLFTTLDLSLPTTLTSFLPSDSGNLYPLIGR
jgi:hypothetical protein